jgi:hypothetical protein
MAHATSGCNTLSHFFYNFVDFFYRPGDKDRKTVVSHALNLPLLVPVDAVAVGLDLNEGRIGPRPPHKAVWAAPAALPAHLTVLTPTLLYDVLQVIL